MFRDTSFVILRCFVIQVLVKEISTYLAVPALAFFGHSQVRLAVLPSAAASVLVEFWLSQVRLAVLPSAAASFLVETALLSVKSVCFGFFPVPSAVQPVGVKIGRGYSPAPQALHFHVPSGGKDRSRLLPGPPGSTFDASALDRSLTTLPSWIFSPADRSLLGFLHPVHTTAVYPRWWFILPTLSRP